MELKVRVWDNQEKKFFNPTFEAYKGKLEEILFGQSGDICLRRINEHGIVVFEHESIYPNRFVKSIFTGLKDKNGKEIYEGDLYVSFGNVYEIVFKNGAFCGGKNINCCTPMAWECDDEKDELIEGVFNLQIEIIGNIYENSELLKK
jgi:uncharacterized phage protein (TIGR01671 family)